MADHETEIGIFTIRSKMEFASCRVSQGVGFFERHGVISDRGRNSGSRNRFSNFIACSFRQWNFRSLRLQYLDESLSVDIKCQGQVVEQVYVDW